jgi:hypothetical protein
MLSRGADLGSFGSILAGLFQHLNAGFDWKVRTVRNMGYSDWVSDSSLALSLSNNILHGACEEANLQEVLFGLEIADLDPNLEGFNRRTALGNAASKDFLKGAAMLIDCGAEVDSSQNSMYGTPLFRSLNVDGVCTDVTQYLLLCGANPQLISGRGESLWQRIWGIVCDGRGNRPTIWSFIRLEGELAHLLLHESDPFGLFLAIYRFHAPHPFDRWNTSKLQLRAPEVARSWSYGLPQEQANSEPSNDWICKFEDAEKSRAPQSTFSWSRSSMIYQTPPETGQKFAQHTDVAEDHFQSTRIPEGDHIYGVPGHMMSSPEDGREHFTDSEDGNTQSETEDPGDDEDIFFRRQTQFYHHISSSRGRKMLSRFPMVLALCNALQFAGYRAEMDDEGDIWYEIGDGDRYFDARENLPEDYRDNIVGESCPMCQDFPKFGLGHILRDIEEAKRELLEYREKVKAKKSYLF